VLVGLTLRDRREALNKSLRATAVEAGIDASALSRIERGLRVPRADTLRRLCRVLDLTEAEYAIAALVPTRDKESA
jgi:transcriptional regulator with XRE-family HTH domain